MGDFIRNIPGIHEQIEEIQLNRDAFIKIYMHILCLKKKINVRASK